MSKLLLAISALVLLTSCTGVENSLPVHSPAINSASSSTVIKVNRSQDIVNVFPVEEQVTCQKPSIGVGLWLSDAMRTDDAFNQTLHSLKLDGEDILQQATYEGTAELPQSFAGLTYQPSVPLAFGQHEVTFAFPDDTGAVQTYTWRFYATDMDCPEE